MTYALLAVISFSAGILVAVVLMAGAEDAIGRKVKRVDRLV